MATSLLEFFGFKVSVDTKELSTGLTSADKKAKEISNSIASSIQKMATATGKTVKAIDSEVTALRGTSNRELKTAVGEFGSWFETVFSEFKQKHPKLQRLLHLDFLKPLQKKFSTVKDELFGVSTGSMELFKKTTDFFIEGTTDAVLNSFNRVESLVKNTAKRIHNNLRTQAPALHKFTEGAWLATKTAVLGTSSAILSIPEVSKKMWRTSKNFISSVSSGFTTVKDSVGGAIQLFKNFSNGMKESFNKTKNFIKKITGMDTLLEKIKQGANIVLKITGITAALGGLSTLVGFIRGDADNAISHFLDIIRSAFAGVERALFNIVNEVLPIVLDILRPLIIFLDKGINAIARGIQMATIHGGVFKEIMDTIEGVMKAIVNTLVEIAVVFVKDIIPVLMPLLKTIIQEVASLLKDILPLISKTLKEIAPLIVQLLKDLTPVIKDLLIAFVEIFKALVEALGEMMPELVTAIREVLPDLIPAIKELIIGVAQLIKAVAPLVTLLIKFLALLVGKVGIPLTITLFTTLAHALGFVATVAGELLQFFIKKFNPFLLKGIHLIINVLETAVQGVSSAWSSVFGFIMTDLRGKWQEVKDIFRMDDVIKDTQNFFGRLGLTFDHFLKTVKTPVNEIIKLLNQLISVELPLIGALKDVVPGVEPLPLLATGGIVKKPTIAGIGEAGPEMVLPLKKEVLQRVIPTMVKVDSKVDFDKKMETVHGAAMFEILRRIHFELEKQGRKVDTNQIGMIFPGKQMGLGMGGLE